MLAGRGAVDYRDACTFFSKTYLTEGLTQLLIDVMQRLAGSGKTEAVIQLQTAFGGGKTHTLLTLYHLLTSPNPVAKLPEIQALIAAAGLKQIPTARVACLVGTALNADQQPHILGRNGLAAWRRAALCQAGQERRAEDRPRHGSSGRSAGRGRAVPDPAG